ncbi:Group 1 truncated hemoglobin GlbN [Roseovarius litorisediminis]|uniref:Group 1 truncated hemoglobin GlbN n=1 Tax=Roseovarius litorisediminis TaxID=1312363 RepID=A0A1Y5TR09_9RHOB|nr:group 1 truncated hemoglobin [Roseovarius litorisediminis]SLN69867.1 Group 1 truncated hemoglobin GlbN [Roseovarius litorisediminis]
MEKTLFEKYGGFSTISKLVLTFYDRMLEDDDVGPFFDDVDLSKLIDHQTKFISALMGGPATFSDDHIERAHRHMTIENHHFDRLKEIVAETLADFDIEAADIEAVLDGFEQRRVLLIRNANVD